MLDTNENELESILDTNENEFIDMQQKHSLFCLTCHVTFTDPGRHREHYTTNWHCFNLQRKIKELLPVTEAEFDAKHASYLQDTNCETVRQYRKKQVCKMCLKTFSNMKQYEVHLTSKRHKKRIEEGSPAVDIEETRRIGLDDIIGDMLRLYGENWIDKLNPNLHCLFCFHYNHSILRNLRHMEIEHSFFIPDREYCNLPALLLYLGQKIYRHYKCLWCNGSGKRMRSAGAAIVHMYDKGHCKIKFEGEAMKEYLHFYNYSSDNNCMDPWWVDVTLDEASEIIVKNDIDNLYENFFQTDDIDSMKESDVTGADVDYEMVLPSGKAIGHRAFARYYKQNIKPTKESDHEKILKIRDVKGLIVSIRNNHRSLGKNDDTICEAAKRMEQNRADMYRGQMKQLLQLQVKQNKLQKHVKSQVNYF